MTLNTNLKNIFLVIFTTLILSACSTAKKAGDIEGDVYTGKETVEYLASGVPDRVFFATNKSSLTTASRATLRKQATFLRKNKNRQTLSFDEGIAVQETGGLSDAHFDSNPEKAAIQAETRKKILDAVDELPEDQKQILILKEIDGLAYKEIAEVLNIPQGTVMSRLYYARKKLQEILVGLENL